MSQHLSAAKIYLNETEDDFLHIEGNAAEDGYDEQEILLESDEGSTYAIICKNPSCRALFLSDIEIDGGRCKNCGTPYI